MFQQQVLVYAICGSIGPSQRQNLSSCDAMSAATSSLTKYLTLFNRKCVLLRRELIWRDLFRLRCHFTSIDCFHVTSSLSRI